jgi:Uncharacterised nucleotidyltransferase
MPDAALLSAEARLVYRSAIRAVPPHEVAALARAVDNWPRVVVLAEREVATAALWRMLRTLDDATLDTTVPVDVVTHLRRSTMVSDFRMQQLSRRLQDVVAGFNAAEIPVLLLKGAAVGALTDPSFRSRPMTDLDVLIAREDVPRARPVLLATGWPETTDPVLLEMLQDQHHLPHFVDPQMPGVRLELHVASLPVDHSFALSDRELWSTSREAAAPFAGARIPSPEWFVLHACIHFGWAHTMRFGVWRTIRAIDAYLDGAGLDWDRFVALAERTRAASVCHWTLRLAARLSGLAVPTRVLDRLEPPALAELQQALERHFLAGIVPGEGVACPSVWLSRQFWYLAIRPSWSGLGRDLRWDPERRWDRARGTLSTESRAAQIARHLASFQEWRRFLSRTFFARP